MAEPMFDDNPGGGLDDGGALDAANEAAAAGLYDLAGEYLEQFNELLEASGDGE